MNTSPWLARSTWRRLSHLSSPSPSNRIRLLPNSTFGAEIGHARFRMDGGRVGLFHGAALVEAEPLLPSPKTGREGGYRCAICDGLTLHSPSSPKQAPRNGVELGHQDRIAHFRRRDDGIVERPVGADRAWLVLARKIARQPCHQAL